MDINIPRQVPRPTLHYSHISQYRNPFDNRPHIFFSIFIIYVISYVTSSFFLLFSRYSNGRLVWGGVILQVAVISSYLPCLNSYTTALENWTDSRLCSLSFYLATRLPSLFFSPQYSPLSLL